MAWIRTVAPDEATGFVKETYEALQKQRGFVPEILKVFSIKPESFRASHNLFKTIMFGPSGLSRAEREMIATVVSVVNRCHY